MVEIHGLIEAHGEERVRDAVNEVATRYDSDLIVCVKCGEVKPRGYLGDDGWRCKDCGFYERYANGIAAEIRRKLAGEEL